MKAPVVRVRMAGVYCFGELVKGVDSRLRGNDIGVVRGGCVLVLPDGVCLFFATSGHHSVIPAKAGIHSGLSVESIFRRLVPCTNFRTPGNAMPHIHLAAAQKKPASVSGAGSLSACSKPIS